MYAIKIIQFGKTREKIQAPVDAYVILLTSQKNASNYSKSWKDFPFQGIFPAKCFCKHVCCSQFQTGIPLEVQLVMETTTLQPVQVLQKEEAADILQNDVSQTLAAVLLWLQTAMEDETLAGNIHLQLAESNLKSSVKQLVRLHYALLEK